MDRLEKLVSDIKERSVYLMDKECYIESIFDRIKQDIAFLPLAVTGVSGTGYDLRGIFCGFPSEYLTIYVNKDHSKLNYYKEHTITAQKVGFGTNFWNDVAINHPADYEERYKKYGFQCGTETVFCNHAGVPIGLFAGIKATESSFREEEQTTIREMAHHIFYAFLRYRWIVNTDFLTLLCFDEFPFGIITCNDDEQITYINETFKRMLRNTINCIPDKLPIPLSDQKRILESIPNHRISEPYLIFQEIEAYVPPFGGVLCFRFDEEHGGKYLPLKGSGWVFFIDSRKRDMAIKDLLSPRELSVIRLICRGMQDKEIAYEMGLSIKTVQVYVRSLFSKLDTQNRTEAAVKAIKLGLL